MRFAWLFLSNVLAKHVPYLHQMNYSLCQIVLLFLSHTFTTNKKEANVFFSFLHAWFPSFGLIRTEDPIFSLATPLQPQETKSHTREIIAAPDGPKDRSADPKEQMEEATSVQGGWFGRGYRKGRRSKRKKRVV